MPLFSRLSSVYMQGLWHVKVGVGTRELKSGRQNGVFCASRNVYYASNNSPQGFVERLFDTVADFLLFEPSSGYQGERCKALDAHLSWVYSLRSNRQRISTGPRTMSNDSTVLTPSRKCINASEYSTRNVANRNSGKQLPALN
jgi:hypothetical protein